MELKKKTIIWEENTEPPKNYFWVKPDGKVYEWTLEKEDWAESETIQLYKDPDAPEYSEETPSETTTSAITAYEEKQTADTLSSAVGKRTASTVNGIMRAGWHLRQELYPSVPGKGKPGTDAWHRWSREEAAWLLLRWKPDKTL